MTLPSPRDLFDLSGRVVVVTGGAGLIAREIAIVLGGAGARLVLLDRQNPSLDARVDDLATCGLDARGLCVDIGDSAAVERAFADIAARDGRIDVLVNNAATKSPHFFSTLEDLPPDEWTSVLAVNLTGSYLCSRSAVPVMRAGGGGSIVNIASIYGIVGPDPRLYEGLALQSPPVYAASKGGLIALTRYIATYHARDGIRCNAITPGGIGDNVSGAFSARYVERVPLRRMGQPRDVASAVLYLASAAASYVTGQNLVVDGGLTAW